VLSRADKESSTKMGNQSTRVGVRKNEMEGRSGRTKCTVAGFGARGGGARRGSMHVVEETDGGTKRKTVSNALAKRGGKKRGGSCNPGAVTV